MATYSHNPADLTGTGTPSASEENAPDNLASKAFDDSNVVDSCWLTDVSTTGWLKFDFGSGNAKIVATYTVSVEVVSMMRINYPKTWTFQGSNDDSNWTTLDTQTNVAAWSNNEMRTYEVSSPASYRYYRINVTANQGGSLLAIAELEMMAEAVESTITDDAGLSDAYEAFTLTEETINNVGISDVYAAVVLSGKITNNAGISDVYEIDTPHRNITGDVGMSALFECGIYFAEIAETLGTSDIHERFAEKYVTITNEAGMNDENALAWHFIRSIQDGVDSADICEVIRIYNKTITDTLSSWDTLKWAWHKSIADAFDAADTAEKILGIPVREWLTVTDTEITNWNGTEAVSDSFYAVDFSKAIHAYDDLIADGMAVADAVRLALELIVVDIVTFTDAALDIGVFQHLIEDGMTLEDIARRCFPKSISDSFAATDTSLVDLLVLLQISDSLAISEVLTPGHTINQTISDALDVLDTIAIKQLIQELVQDGLNIEIIVELDGEVWECWVVNTNDFHISVYSGYDYNSFAIQNDTVYGCKSDGIYELSGDDDDGTAFKAGIILPATQFNSPKNKRFRKAYFGVSGDNLLMKIETESGSRTFRMIDTEMSLTRDLRGRKWQLTLEDFDSLDFAELQPVLLSKK